MRHRHWTALTLLPVLLVACESNPAAPVDDGDDDHAHTLDAELTLSSDHLHILSEMTFTVRVTDDHGDVVTDLAGVSVERLAEGTDTWRATELELSGDVWTAPYTFMSSGAYRLRVTVLEHGAAEPEVVYTMPEPVHAVRAHEVVGDLRVEFETFPGHLHEGDVATARFWIMEPEEDANGVRPPMPGLHVVITCEQADGSFEEHHAHETEPGVYEAEHTFTAAGEFTAGIRIGEHGEGQREAAFRTNVAHQH